MKYADAPVLCNDCREHPDLQGLVVAGVIRDDELPPRCPLCGFIVSLDGSRESERGTTRAPDLLAGGSRWRSRPC